MGTSFVRGRFHTDLDVFNLEDYRIAAELDFTVDSNGDGIADNVVNYLSNTPSVDSEGQHYNPSVPFAGVYVDIPLVIGNKYFFISECTVLTAADTYIEVGHGAYTFLTYLPLKNGNKNVAGLMFTALGDTGRFRYNTNSGSLPELIWHSLKLYDLTGIEEFGE